MKVTVISVQAMIVGRDDVVWTGDVTIPGVQEPDAVNAHLGRYFNRVDDDDGERLEAIGYRLPSLSIGDVVYWQGSAYKAIGLGFEHLTPEVLVMANVFDALRNV